MIVYAVHYVKVAGRLYNPGDRIEYDLPEVDRNYLAEKGAIRIEDAEVLPATDMEPEVVFKPMEETEAKEPEETDALDDIVPAAHKKSTRKKG